MSIDVSVWMPIYIGDYLADTSHLTTEQHGAYLLLMLHYWRKGPLPNDDAVLAQIARMPMHAWSNAQALLKQFFSICDDGLLHHKRVDAELRLAKENRGLKTERASKAANARWEKQKNAYPVLEQCISMPQADAQALPKQCPSPSPSPSPKEKTETPKLAVIVKEDKDGFSPSMAASAVMQKCVISGRHLQGVLTDVFKALLSDGKDLLPIVDSMHLAWSEYHEARSRLQFPVGAEKFFGEGIWNNKAAWVWKPGQEPKATRRYANVKGETP